MNCRSINTAAVVSGRSSQLFVDSVYTNHPNHVRPERQSQIYDQGLGIGIRAMEMRGDGSLPPIIPPAWITAAAVLTGKLMLMSRSSTEKIGVKGHYLFRFSVDGQNK